MELRAGYKKTEIGLIPTEWLVRTIDEITTKIGSGVTPTGGAKIYKQSGLPFIRSQNVGRGFLELSDVAYIDKEIHETFLGTEIKVGDVFLNITGASIGRSAIADERVRGGNVNQHVCIIRPNESELNSKFLNSILLSDFGQRKIESFQAGGNREGLNFSQIRSLLIPLPSLTEQAAIANALSDADALIDSLQKLIAKKRQIKQGVMQTLLNPYENGVLKAGWKKKKFGEIGNCIRGVSYNGDWDLFPHDTHQTIRLFRSNNIQRAAIEYTGLQFVDSKRVKAMQIMQFSDVLICMANGSKNLVGKSARFNPLENKSYTFGAFMGCYRVTDITTDKDFIFYNFQTYKYRNYIDVLLSGSSINNLKPSDIESIEVGCPSLDEQRRISMVLLNMDSEIASLETKLTKYQQIKQGMMQNLLTGRIRLV